MKVPSDSLSPWEQLTEHALLVFKRPIQKTSNFNSNQTLTANYTTEWTNMGQFKAAKNGTLVKRVLTAIYQRQ
jgi:hypothetical protein